MVRPVIILYLIKDPTDCVVYPVFVQTYLHRSQLLCGSDTAGRPVVLQNRVLMFNLDDDNAPTETAKLKASCT